jgi:hypothetical protein
MSRNNRDLLKRIHKKEEKESLKTEKRLIRGIKTA